MFDTYEIYTSASVQEVDCLTKHDNHVHKYVHPDKLRLPVTVPNYTECLRWLRGSQILCNTSFEAFVILVCYAAETDRYRRFGTIYR